MRNKYTKEFEDFVSSNASKYTKEELRLLIQNKYNIQISKDALRRYMNRHKTGKCKDYKKNNIRNVLRCPIGTERITNEGVFIKVAEPDKWKRKSRIMYEKYYNYKLKDDDYIVFLNQNNNDFRKENLIKSSRKEIAYLHNNKTFSSDSRLTKLGILTARLISKVKEKEND